MRVLRTKLEKTLGSAFKGWEEEEYPTKESRKD